MLGSETGFYFEGRLIFQGPQVFYQPWLELKRNWRCRQCVSSNLYVCHIFQRPVDLLAKAEFGILVSFSLLFALLFWYIHIICTLASSFARQREATSSYNYYHTGMQEQVQKAQRGLDVISDVKVYEKTPRTLNAQWNMERAFESVAT